MVRARFSVALGFVLLAAAALPAGASVFHLSLTNGSVIDTLYEPQEASWDHGMVLVLTDAGNWIGVHKDEIANVASENATRGFGIAINATTIALGEAPNDLPVPGKEAAGTPTQQALQSLLQQQQPQPNYTIQQGVQTEDTQGIPSPFISPYATGAPAVTPIVVPPTPPPAHQ